MFSHQIRFHGWEDAQTDWKDKKDDELVHGKTLTRFAHVDFCYTGAVEILEQKSPTRQRVRDL